MVHARGGASFALASLLCMMLYSNIANAATYTVGDAAGWSPNVIGWTAGKKFSPGDVLVFNYDPKLHNVAQVDQTSYDTCTVNENSKVFQTGNDKIVLGRGRFYFISSILGDCDKNLIKIELLAL